MHPVLFGARQNDPYFQKRVWNSQSINSIVFKYFTKQCPSYLNEVFELACPNNLRTRNSYVRLICPFRKPNMGQNALSFIGPSIWNTTQEAPKKPTALILSNITMQNMQDKKKEAMTSSFFGSERQNLRNCMICPCL